MKDVKIDYIDFQPLIDKFINFKESIIAFMHKIRFYVVNFFPGDFMPRLLLASIGVVFVLGICKLFEMKKSK